MRCPPSQRRRRWSLAVDAYRCRCWATTETNTPTFASHAVTLALHTADLTTTTSSLVLINLSRITATSPARIATAHCVRHYTHTHTHTRNGKCAPLRACRFEGLAHSLVFPSTRYCTCTIYMHLQARYNPRRPSNLGSFPHYSPSLVRQARCHIFKASPLTARSPTASKRKTPHLHRTHITLSRHGRRRGRFQQASASRSFRPQKLESQKRGLRGSCESIRDHSGRIRPCR